MRMELLLVANGNTRPTELLYGDEGFVQMGILGKYMRPDMQSKEFGLQYIW